jgi:hypothetical protein
MGYVYETIPEPVTHFILYLPPNGGDESYTPSARGSTVYVVFSMVDGSLNFSMCGIMG